MISKSRLNSRFENDYFTIYSADYHLVRQLANNLVRWLLLLVITIALTFTLIIAFSRFFTKRIRILQAAVAHASNEDYDFFQQINGKDEVSQISIDFHKIIMHIQANEERIYESQLIEKELLNKQQQMEFNLLASQINPHFLFNTLESIRMMALKEKQPRIAEAIKLLAKSMRYNLSAHGTQVNTLTDQLDAVYVYVNIQKMRFGDRVNFTSELEPTINPDYIQLLPLLIQPLIENSITHGLERLTQKGNIRLTIREEQNDLFIAVQDDGVGISTERLTEIENTLHQPAIASANHIGLQNIQQRIQLFYGLEYGLTLSSVEDLGTRVELRIKKTPDIN